MEQGLCDSQYGKCDRVNHCGYEFRPDGNTTVEVEEKQKQPISVLPRSVVVKALKHGIGKDPLTEFLLQASDLAPQVLRDYVVSSVPFRDTVAPVFWLIDHNGKVRSGKMMVYETKDGVPHRKHHTNQWRVFGWVHTKIKDYNLETCFFGAHLVPKYPDKPVHVVESEKTALIMSCVAPDYLWLAAGSMTMLQPEYLPDLRGRDVVLHPDKGEKTYAYWGLKAKEILEQNLVGSIKISNFTQDREELEEGDDISDYYVTKLMELQA